MASHAALTASTPTRPHATRHAVWFGDADTPEFADAARAVADRMRIVTAAWAPPSSIARIEVDEEPLLAFLAIDAPARFVPDHAVAITRRWPLCRIVAVASSLAEGRRRSGPPLPGVEEVAWHELAGRLERWLAALDEGRPGPLGLPATARREDRLLELQPPRSIRGLGLAIAASTTDSLEGLDALVRSLGCEPTTATVGVPSIDLAGDVLVWDVGGAASRHLPWLRLVAANRPATQIVLLESFPRGESVRAARDAGAAAVLGRPTSAEALAGTLEVLVKRRGSGLGSAKADR